MSRPTPVNITSLSEEALMQLQDCFENTDWDIFAQNDLQEYTESVLFYIRCCVENVTVEKRILKFSNEKAWMTGKVRKLFKDRYIAFKSSDKALYSTARAALKKGIKEAKDAQKLKIEDQLTHKNPRMVWRGLQQLTNYKGKSNNLVVQDGALAEELNHFSARYEVQGTVTTTPQPLQTLSTHSPSLTLSEEDVRRVLKAVNPRKAAGPDGVPGKVLRACADPLTRVFTRIFNLSLAQETIPSCLKSSIIIPVPKKPAAVELKDFRPIALTPVIMKCFEKLVLHHIKSSLPASFDPYQFAYRTNRSTEDAIAMTVHTALSHLEHKKSYVRILFIDFSSAFNTIIPNILVGKLLDLGLSPSMCCWIKHFLTDRPASEDWPLSLLHHHPEHRLPAGLCAEPFAVLSVHI